MSDWTLMLLLASTLMSTLSGGVASVAFSLPGNCVWATYNKLTKFPKSEENSIWGICYCGRLELHNKVYLQSQRDSQGRAVLILRWGEDLKWWGAVITMARSMGRQRLKKKKEKTRKKGWARKKKQRKEKTRNNFRKLLCLKGFSHITSAAGLYHDPQGNFFQI